MFADGTTDVRIESRFALLFALTLIALCGCARSMPEGTSFAGARARANDVVFLADRTWVDASGARHVEQEIFDEVFAIIARAERLIVLDMFLYNDFQGPIPETTRALSDELTDALIERKRRRPSIEIVVITDPVNNLYGGLPSPHFARLRERGIRVVVTDLNELPDSSPLYSAFWRLLVRPFGNEAGGLLPNPIGQGNVSLRTYLAILNFKANHRKTLVADAGDGYVGLVSSGNPHDGSSAHRNAAIRFDGPAVLDLLHTENAVLALSGEQPLGIEAPVTGAAGPTTVQVVTESRIEGAIFATLNASLPGDRVDLMMFYLSDRDVVEALISASERGVELRVLLDPNKDAFGREKSGIPNRSVAWELTQEGIPLRWCDTHGEQCHAKMLLQTTGQGGATLISGSANFTRRNLHDFNLETDVVVAGSAAEPVFRDALAYFDESWSNTPGREYSVEYAAYADPSWFRRQRYRFMEASGFSSF